MSQIRCVVERITYQNPEKGFCILKARAKGYQESIAILGRLLDIPVGSVLLCQGEWKVDRKFGSQFMVETFQEVLPATVYGIEKYLGSGLIRGIGPRFAHQIVSVFGASTIEVIEEQVERLLEVPGIGRKRVEQVRQSWQRQKEIKDVMLFLQDHGVSTGFAAKIYRSYGNDSIAKVRENPYRLADDIWGIGFRTADSIARKMGYGLSDPPRCRSGILYTLNALSDEGHVHGTRAQILESAQKLLEAEPEPIAMALDEMTRDGALIMDGDAIYLPPLFFSEKGSAERFRRLLSVSHQGLFDSQVDISAIEKATGMRYDQIQADAIRQAVASRLLVLTGGPGTGKTTTVQGIIAAFRSMGLSILLAAPTGRAAKRMSEATGMEARTIHRLLEYNPKDGYKRNEENPLRGDALIVDECSMIDIVLMYNLMKAVPLGMRLILVGDIDQLPSVGPGNVLRDIIDSGCVPVVRLVRIFRQALTSRIICSAHRINQGKMPDLSNGRDTDFFFLRVEDADSVPEEIVRLVRDRLPGAYRIPCSQIQVLTPMQRSAIGATNLNIRLQEALNPSREGLSRGGFSFRRDDRVMQIRNNYDKDVFNGDIGTVVLVNAQDRELTVDYDGHRVRYDITELDEITLAYATTIHKSQGSEYPVVIIPVLMTHFIMLQRNLIYTGVTRARRICVLIGQEKALRYAVKNQTVTLRNTRLKERLRGDQ